MSTTKKTVKAAEDAATPPSVSGTGKRWTLKDVNKKSLKIHRVGKLCIITFNINIPSGTSGADITMQRLKQIHGIKVMPQKSPMKGLSWWGDKNSFTLNHDAETEKHLVEFVVIGSR